MSKTTNQTARKDSKMHYKMQMMMMMIMSSPSKYSQPRIANSEPKKKSSWSLIRAASRIT